MTTEIATAPTRAVVIDDSDQCGLLDSAKFEHLQRVAKVFADSTMVPAHYQNNVANCIIGIHLAVRLGADPLLVMQKTYIVHGKPAMEAQLAIGLANGKGVFTTRIQYELTGEGDTRACRAYATMRDTGNVAEQHMSVAVAKKNGWWQKKDSLWPKATDLMLQYRSAAWLIRTNAPEVLMGLITKEEADDIEPIEVRSTPVSDTLTPKLATPPKPAKSEAGEPEPEAEPSKEFPEQGPITESYMMDLGTAETILDVAPIEAAAAANDDLTDESKAEVAKWCKERIDGIKSGRGVRSNT